MRTPITWRPKGLQACQERQGCLQAIPGFCRRKAGLRQLRAGFSRLGHHEAALRECIRVNEATAAPLLCKWWGTTLASKATPLESRPKSGHLHKCSSHSRVLLRKLSCFPVCPLVDCLEENWKSLQVSYGQFFYIAAALEPGPSLCDGSRGLSVENPT